MIVQVAVPYELGKVYDYSVDKYIMPGTRVVINFANRKIVGLVVSIKSDTDYDVQKIKPILFSLDNSSTLPDSLIELSAVMSRHYLYGRGAMLDIMLPPYLRKMNKFEATVKEKSFSIPDAQEYIYFQEKNQAIERIKQYCLKVNHVLDSGRSVIIVVPNREDIAAIADALEDSCADAKVARVTATNKEKENFSIWEAMRTGDLNVCVGTRLALFAPFESLGLIIVDKENAYGHIHGVKPFFSSRDIALFRAKIEKSDVYFHSDFPSIEMYHFIQRSRFEHRVLGQQNEIDTLVYDLNDYNFKRYPIFADLCTGIMRRFLESGKKVMVFWNRNGFSNLVRCDHCKTILKCTHCDCSVGYDKDKEEYRCNKCKRTFAKLSKCPSCKHAQLKPLGVGVERVKQNYLKFFPGKNIFVYDEKSNEIPKDSDLLVVTQKFLESNQAIDADLVIVSGIDQQISLGDFSTSYELFLTYSRLKSYAKEHCVVFTLNPDYYPIASINHKEEWFYEQEMEQRKDFELPPYASIATLVLRAKVEENLHKKVREFASILNTILPKDGSVDLYGPMEEVPYRMRAQYHIKIIVKARQRKQVQEIISQALAKFKKGSTKLSLKIQ